MAATRDQIEKHQRALAAVEQRDRDLVSSAATKLGIVGSDVTSVVSHHEQRGQAAGRAGNDQILRARREAEQRATIRAAKLGNDIKAAAFLARDLGAALLTTCAPIATADLAPEQLCRPLTVRETVCIGNVNTPNTSAIDRHLPEIPAFVPLINAGHLIIEAARGDAGLGSLLTTLISQAYMSAPAGQMVVTIFDPRLSSVTAGFQSNGSTEAKVLANLHPSQNALENALGEMLGRMVSISQSMAGQYGTMGDLVAGTGQHEHQYHCLVILDAPSQWSTKAYVDLERILSQGATRGISIILHRDPAEELPRDADYSKLTAGQSVLAVADGQWTLQVPGVRPPIAVSPGEPVTLAAQQRLMGLIVAEAKVGALPKVAFDALVERRAESSADGMRILLGKKGTQVVEFTLGSSDANLHNVLVGGAVGTGKTNLLKVLIYSLAARYSPDELELFLLDFKEGVEFQQFLGPTPLPHATVVSIESDVQFGLATLRHFCDELERRSGLFKDAGTTNLAKYREVTGAVLPRWVLVADEFQVLFEGDTNERATELLETVARKGRAFGLHVVLASQTLTGIRFSGGKSEAIFAQFPVRAVLGLPRPESQIFLGTGNDAAAHLRYRGQAILNTHHGLIDDNQQFVVAFADDDHLATLKTDLAVEARGRGVKSRAVRVYRGREPVSARTLIESTARPSFEFDSVPVWLGQECTVNAGVAAAALNRTPGANVLVTGNDVQAAVAIVQVATLSVAAALPCELRVLALETLLPAHQRIANTDAWLATLTSLGADVTRFTGDQCDELLEEIESSARQDVRTVVALLGADNCALQVAAENHNWETAIRQWPRAGVHVIGQWADLREVPGRYYQLVPDFQTMVFTQAPVSTIKEATDSAAYHIPANTPGRATVFSALNGSFRSVAAVRPLDTDDFAAWRRSW